MSNQYRLLHISDLHFGQSHFFRQAEEDPQRFSLTDALADVLEADFDGLILSGDIFGNEPPSDKALAEIELRTLLKRFDPGQSWRAMCVPGNHDLTWDKRFQPFLFYDQLVESIGLPSFRSRDLPALVKLPAKSPGARGLCLILLNSCMVEGESTAGLGRVSDQQLKKVSLMLKNQSVTADTHTILAVLHHHLLPIWPSEDILNSNNPLAPPLSRASITVDAVEVLRNLSNWGVCAVLHGHQHRHSVLTYQDHCRSELPIHILAAGSVADRTANRQFFVYEVQSAAINVISYERSNGNPAQFEQRWQKALPLPVRSPAAHTPIVDVCQIGFAKMAEVQSVRGESNKTSNEPNADSDLYYVFMTVVDCEKARRLIRTFVMNYRPSASRGDQFYVTIHGMYDLLGKWDLVLRVRAGGALRWNAFFEALEQHLENANLLFKRKQDNSVDWFKIDRELSELTETGVSISEEHRLFRRGATRDYEIERCQKGFIYVALPRLRGERKDMMARLRTGVDKTTQDIVVGVCESANALIIEMYMTCPQSGYVQKLNREIGPILADFDCQKYTLLCYEYDEEPVVNATPHLVKLTG